MSDSPTLCTGFGTVTREVLCRLAATGRYEVACVAWGYDGCPYDSVVAPYPLYPSRPPNLGRDILERAIHDFRPDVLVALGDVWMIEWSRELTEGRCPLVAYVPFDGSPFYKPWEPFLASAERVVTCARFGHRLLTDALGDVRVDLIPHGVDTTVFRPLPDYLRPPELEGRFIVGCTARNQPRKNLPVLVEAFATFAASYDDAVLYLHSDPDDIGWDLLDLLRRHGVYRRACLSRSASVGNGVTPRRLNEVYNLFDVMALPTGGEGFGLPIVEAMAAGTPVVATAHSACIEHLEGGRGQIIDVRCRFTAGRHNIDYALADADHLATILAHLHDNPDQRDHYVDAGLAYARTLDWKAIMPLWEQLLPQVAATPPPSLPRSI